MSDKKEGSVIFISLKALYDRINLLSKDDWSRIIDLAEQTKSADYLEISNLKTLYSKIQKKDRSINEFNIRKAHEVLLRLSKKFKVNY